MCSQSDAHSLQAKAAFSQTRLLSSSMNLHKAGVRWTHSCEHARQTCLTAERSGDDWSLLRLSIPPSLQAVAESKPLSASPQAWFAHCSHFIQLCNLPKTIQRLQIRQQYLSTESKLPQANSRSLRRMKEERQIHRHCFANEPHTFAAQVRLHAVHSSSQLYLQLFAKTANQRTS